MTPDGIPRIHPSKEDITYQATRQLRELFGANNVSDKVPQHISSQAIIVINCEEYNDHLYYDNNYWGSVEYQSILNQHNLSMEWYDAPTAYIYIDNWTI